MNATDLVIMPTGRLLSRTAVRSARTERNVSTPRADAFAGGLPIAVPERATEGVACACGLALETVRGQVYNEEAFQYFLTIERLRIAVAGNHLLLALVDVKRTSAPATRDDADLIPKLFRALRALLRETDFVGWYREKDVVGAVLPQFGGSTVSASTRRVGQRLCQGLAERLPAALARRLEVHVYQVPSIKQS